MMENNGILPWDFLEVFFRLEYNGKYLTSFMGFPWIIIQIGILGKILKFFHGIPMDSQLDEDLMGNIQILP